MDEVLLTALTAAVVDWRRATPGAMPDGLPDDAADGATLDVPGAPRVVHVPGHTAGSVAFHVPGRDAVFVAEGLLAAGQRGPDRRLLKAGEEVALAPKAFDLLVFLIERRQRAVSKAELMQLLWPDSYVAESNLTQTIFVLRKTLGDTPEGSF